MKAASPKRQQALENWKQHFKTTSNFFKASQTLLEKQRSAFPSQKPDSWTLYAAFLTPKHLFKP
jgi:hypothetical protein